MESQPHEQPEEPRLVPRRPELSEAQKQQVFRAAGRRVAATVRGEPPEPMDKVLGEVADRPLLGAFVSLKRSGKLRSCCGYLGDSIPLAEAVGHAAMRAAKDDPRFPPIAADELDELNMEVWLLWNLEPVLGGGEARAAGFEIGTHGLQISRGTARGLLLPSVAVEHNLDAEGFLRQVCLKAHLPSDAWMDDNTALMRFQGYSIRGPLDPRPEEDDLQPRASGAATPEPYVRPPAVAGQFYPGTPDELNRALDVLLADRPQPEPWAGAMVPHAGWVYSGRLAAAVLSRVKIPDRVIVFCPRHRPLGAAWAVAPHRVWSLPGRDVESDPELARRLADAVTGLELDPVAHRSEHAIEVELPLVARLAPHARVVGIAIQGGDLVSLGRFADELAGAILQENLPDRPLLVISSDMNHHSQDTETRRRDRLALDAIEALDPAGLYETVIEHGISMCGVLPAVIVMETLRRLGSLSRCELVGYATSADAFGDRRSTVGYAGVLFN